MTYACKEILVWKKWHIVDKLSGSVRTHTRVIVLNKPLYGTRFRVAAVIKTSRCIWFILHVPRYSWRKNDDLDENGSIQSVPL